MWHAMAGLLAYAGHDATPAISDEERAEYRIVGAGLLWELLQAMQAVARRAL